jgi:UDP-N-acetylglucosamine--N-acetylmuramyl-(pentapeptide) pyrophosphoryl-undecaprenol N-acetylglucosamine transferase
MKILFTGGGTGGHTTPIIAIARELRRADSHNDLQLSYMGPKDRFAELLFSQEDIKVHYILSGKIRRYLTSKSIIENIIDIGIKVPIGIVQAFFKVLFLAPDIIISKGGYGSIPTAIAGWIFRVPIFLHESDIEPGLSNKIVSRFAKLVFTSFPDTKYFSPKKMILTGNPIRKRILEGSKEEAKTTFHLAGGKPVLLILGGSQGAQKVNDILLVVLDEMLKEFEILHQTGEANYDQIKREVKVIVQPEQEPYYHPMPFFRENQLRHAYAATDFVITRAGSAFISEIAALGKPSIVVPLSGSAQNHQIANAYAYANTKAAIVLEEANLTPHFFLEKLRFLFANPQEMQEMTTAAKEFAKPDAARAVATNIMKNL